MREPDLLLVDQIGKHGPFNTTIIDNLKTKHSCCFCGEPHAKSIVVVHSIPRDKDIYACMICGALSILLDDKGHKWLMWLAVFEPVTLDGGLGQRPVLLTFGQWPGAHINLKSLILPPLIVTSVFTIGSTPINVLPRIAPNV